MNLLILLLAALALTHQYRLVAHSKRGLETLRDLRNEILVVHPPSPYCYRRLFPFLHRLTSWALRLARFSDTTAFSGAIVILTFMSLTLAFHALLLWFSCFAPAQTALIGVLFVAATYFFVFRTSYSHHVWTTLEVALAAYALVAVQRGHPLMAGCLLLTAALNRETAVFLGLALPGGMVVFPLLVVAAQWRNRPPAVPLALRREYNRRMWPIALWTWAIYIFAFMVFVPPAAWSSKLAIIGAAYLLTCAAFTYWTEVRPLIYVFWMPLILARIASI